MKVATVREPDELFSQRGFFAFPRRYCPRLLAVGSMGDVELNTTIFIRSKKSGSIARTVATKSVHLETHPSRGRYASR